MTCPGLPRRSQGGYRQSRATARARARRSGWPCLLDPDPNVPILGGDEQVDVVGIHGQELPDRDDPGRPDHVRGRLSRRRSSRTRRATNTSAISCCRKNGPNGHAARRLADAVGQERGEEPRSRGLASDGFDWSRPGCTPASRGDGSYSDRAGRRPLSARFQIVMAARPQQNGQSELRPHELDGRAAPNGGLQLRSCEILRSLRSRARSSAPGSQPASTSSATRLRQRLDQVNDLGMTPLEVADAAEQRIEHGVDADVREERETGPGDLENDIAGTGASGPVAYHARRIRSRIAPSCSRSVTGEVAGPPQAFQRGRSAILAYWY